MSYYSGLLTLPKTATVCYHPARPCAYSQMAYADLTCIHTVYSLMMTCRRFHTICEEPLYRSIPLTIVMNQIDVSDPTVEVLEVLPRELLTCTTSSPRRAAMAALIPSLTIRVTRYPEDWIFESPKAREQLERIEMMLLHLAPTSLEVTAYQDGHPRVTAHILERLDVSHLRSFDPGYAAYGRGQVDHLPFCHGVLVRCASTIQRLYFPQSHFPDPFVSPPPAMP